MINTIFIVLLVIGVGGYLIKILKAISDNHRYEAEREALYKDSKRPEGYRLRPNPKSCCAECKYQKRASYYNADDEGVLYCSKFHVNVNEHYICDQFVSFVDDEMEEFVRILQGE